MTLQALETELAHELIGHAMRAPSVHNTQPWLWQILDDGFELHADRTRQLRYADPSGRNLFMSCGLVLHHLQVAAASKGLACDIAYLPSKTHPDHVATISLSPTDIPSDADRALQALHRRVTDRRRFTSWPIPAERLITLAAAIRTEGTSARPITDVTSRFRVEMLVTQAMTEQESDERYVNEQLLWINHTEHDGIPMDSVPDVEYYPRNRRTRFGHGLYPDAPQETVESSDGLLTICTPDDGDYAWLRAGEALSQVWLEATAEGLSVVPLSQVIELDRTRIGLRHHVFHDEIYPQMLVRIGWQEIGRSSIKTTPRRPVTDVLLP